MTFARTWFVIVCALASVAGHAAALAPSSQPKGEVYVEFDLPTPLMLGDDAVRRLAERIEADTEAAAVFAPLRAEADAAVDDEPDPVAEIVYEGRVSNDPDRVRTAGHLQDMRKLRALTWAHAVTGEARYLDAARRFLSAWTATTRPSGNDVNDNKLTPIVLAFHLLGDDLPEGEREATRAWVRELADVHLKRLDAGPGQGNRRAKRVKIVALAGVALGDESVQTRVADEVRAYVAASLRPDGASYDLEERDAMHYHVGGLSIPTEIAANLGDASLYHYEVPAGEPNAGASLARSVAFTLPYARGEAVHAEWVNSRVPLDKKRWEAGDPYYRPGKPWEPAGAAKLLTWASMFDPSLAPLAARLTEGRSEEDRADLAWLRLLIDAAGRPGRRIGE